MRFGSYMAPDDTTLTSTSPDRGRGRGGTRPICASAALSSLNLRGPVRYGAQPPACTFAAPYELRKCSAESETLVEPKH